MGEVSNTRGDTRSDIVCLEGNGYRPSHREDGWIVSDVMYTLNSTEVHAIAFEPGVMSRCGGHVYYDVAGTVRANAGDNQQAVAIVTKRQNAEWGCI